MFIHELKHLKQGARPKWLILGDFNLIYRLQDKNNVRINRALMSRFQKAIDHLQLREINLIRKKFTWTNNQASPTMSKIDRVFCTTPWENLYDKPALQALSSSTSDHCPLLLAPFSAP
jgi:endonuclease/exonuclease/phosphatase family metal-dependent hydrolase